MHTAHESAGHLQNTASNQEHESEGGGGVNTLLWVGHCQSNIMEMENKHG